MSIKTKLISALKIVIWLSLLSGTGFLLFFVNEKHGESVCKNVEININHSIDNCFVSVEEVKSLIFQSGDSLKSQKMSKINLENVKNKILENPFIKKVKIYSTIDGEVKISVTQKKPLMRVFTAKGQSFYLDEDGFAMPISDKNTARVIIATGKITPDSISQSFIDEKDTLKQREVLKKSNLTMLYQLAKIIDTSAFWKAQISQVNINDRGEMELLPLLGNHVILLGTNENLVEKFEKLFLFYKKELSNFGLSKYKEINIKFKDQLICSKK